MPSALSTDIFYNNCLYMQSIIIYNKLDVLNYYLVYSYLVYYMPLLNIYYGPGDTSGINNKTVKARP